MLGTHVRSSTCSSCSRRGRSSTGREIADRLEIDRRTVRRYVAALQELGIPVEGQRGVGGGYRMRPGFRLPPLMLTRTRRWWSSSACSRRAGSG